MLLDLYYWVIKIWSFSVIKPSHLCLSHGWVCHFCAAEFSSNPQNFIWNSWADPRACKDTRYVLLDYREMLIELCTSHPSAAAIKKKKKWYLGFEYFTQCTCDVSVAASRYPICVWCCHTTWEKMCFLWSLRVQEVNNDLANWFISPLSSSLCPQVPECSFNFP